MPNISLKVECDSAIVKSKNVVLIYDQDCSIAIMYQYKVRPTLVYRDQNGRYCTSFERNEQLVEALKEYESRGSLYIESAGYPEFYESCKEEFANIVGDFERMNEEPKNGLL